MQPRFRERIVFSALLGLVAAAPAFAVPITIDYAAYRLENSGANTLGQPGSADGTVRALFVAGITPDAGTTATATLSGAPTFGPSYDASSDQWFRNAFNPSPADLGPLTVTFQNGADTATFVGPDLTGLTPMKLAQNLTVDASVDPFGPTVNWILPTDTGDLDLIQLVFYSDVTNLEVGTRQLLGAGSTSFDLYGPGTGGLLPLGYQLTVEVRLIDLFDDSLPYSVENAYRISRAFVNYTAPTSTAVPEPGTSVLMLAGLGLLASVARRRRTQL
jgi:hypothetical protein